MENHPLFLLDNGDSASSFATSDNDLFLSTFVDHSTDIRSSIDHDTYVGSGWARSTHIPFSTKFSMNRGLNRGLNSE